MEKNVDVLAVMDRHADNTDAGGASLNFGQHAQAAELRELAACGYNDPHTAMVIDYALARWARGEEAAATLGAIDETFHGISFTSWQRVLAAAMAGAQP